MAGGGGGSSVTKSEIPEELKPLAAAYTDKAMGLAQTPWQGFGGQRFADFTGSQLAGLNAIEQRAMQGSPALQGAEGALGSLMNPQGNPYLMSMVKQAQDSVMGQAKGADLASGSFGNSGIQQAAAREMGGIATNMLGNAYAQDRANQLSAVGLAPQIANAGYMDAAQLLKAGQIRQDQTQQGLDFGYQSFLDQQNKPYKDLASMAGVFQSQPFGSSTTTQQSGGK